MLIHTAVFGEMEVDDTTIYKLPEGLFGFEGITDYALIAKEDEDITLLWLQAATSRVPCFVVFNPFDIITGYEPELDASDLRALAVSSPKELRYLVLAVVPEDVSQTTVNLKSPVVLNEGAHTARQVILRNDYPIRFPLAEASPEDPTEQDMMAAQ